MRHTATWLASVALLGGALSALSGEIVLQPTADTRIYQGQPDANFDSQQLTIGAVRPDEPSLQAVLLQFDLSQISGSIRSAVLTLFTAGNSQMGAGAGMTIEAHRITQEWDADAVTFNERFRGQRWNTAGGDFDPELIASATHLPTNQAGMAITFDVTRLVQSWRDKSVPNQGLILCTPGYPRDARKGELQTFESSENFSKSGYEFMPKLVVTVAE